VHAANGVPLRVEVLGPVRALLGDREIALGPPMQRALLALLALRANRAVGRTELVDALWGDDPPTTAGGSVSTYLSALRRALEPDRPSRAPSALLVSAGANSGYMLRLEPGTLDCDRAEQLRERARIARSSGDLHGAVVQLQSALRLWRGLPFDGISCPFVAGERARVDELRLATVESLADALIALGRNDDAVAELSPVVRQQPLRERPRALLMTALYGAGRKADALEVFEDARRVLVDELGIEPGPELRELHRDLIADKPTAPSPAAAPAGVGALTTPKPAQLPHDVPGFTGRVRELAQLEDVLVGGDRTVAVISAIDGSGGIGKTALAVHVAHRVAGQFPDGQLYVNLRGFDPQQPPLQPAAALGQLLRGLGVEASAIPAETDEQAGLYRSLIAGKRMLVLLDNAASTDQVRPLLPGSPSCSVIVTSRSRLGGLVARDGAHRVTLDVLAEPESVQMLAAGVGKAQIEAQPEAAAELARLCGHLPLALRIAAAQLNDRPHLDLDDLCQELADERARLDVLAVDDESTAVRAVFSWSYHALKPEPARMFRMLGLHAGTEISVAAAAALANVPVVRARRLLDVVASGHLLEGVGRDRYRFHDLLRVYSAECAAEHDSRAERIAAVSRLLDFYLHTANTVDEMLAPFRRRSELPPPVPGGQPMTFVDGSAALAWCETELSNLVAATAQAAELGDTYHATGIPGAMWAFFALRTPWPEWITSHQTGIGAAVAAGDRYGEVRLLIGLGYCYNELRRHMQVLECMERARVVYEPLSGGPLDHVVGGALGSAYFWAGRVDEAFELTNRALAASRESGDRWSEAWALSHLGSYCRVLGRYQESVADFDRALRLFVEMDDRAGAIKVYRELGEAHRHFGKLDRAADCFRGAVRLFRESGGRPGEAWSLHELASVLHEDGKLAEAKESWEQSLAILEEVGDHRVEQVRRRLAAIDAAAGVRRAGR
jgi:DNA-binding SARP family transcriptional activator